MSWILENMLKSWILKVLYWLIDWVKSPLFYLTLFMVFAFRTFLDITLNVIMEDEITHYDQQIIHWLNGMAASTLTRYMLIITHMASFEAITMLLTIALLVAMLIRRYAWVAFLLGSTTGGYIWMMLIKQLLQRTRPVVGTPVLQETGYSFPSGHATIAVCFYGALLFLLFQYADRISVRIAASAIIVPFILLIAFSRIYLGVHYPSDVLAGLCLGAFWSSLCALFYKKGTSNNPHVY